MSEKNWSTKITTHDEDGNPIVRGYNLLDLIDKVNFTQGIFLVLKGELPKENEEKMLNALLVASIDHGVGAPSTTVARVAASSGVESSAAIAAGVASVGKVHGGAAEKLAKHLQKDMTAADLIAHFKEKGVKVPGFGHKIYEVDPRTQALLKIAEETGFKGKFVQKSLEMEAELEKTTGKKLPLNIDGAIATIMSEMGFDWRLGKSLFIISRVAGMAAHVAEEQEQNKLHRLDEDDIEYTGPAKRSI